MVSRWSVMGRFMVDCNSNMMAISLSKVIIAVLMMVNIFLSDVEAELSLYKDTEGSEGYHTAKQGEEACSA
jgi:hypothetical protein